MIKFTLALSFCGLSAFAQNGQIVVNVTNSSNSPVSGAIVRVGARPFRNTITNFHTSKSAGGDGRAAFASVPEGAYEICAQLPNSGLVDSCMWLSSPQQTYVHSGETKIVSIILQKGSRVTVAVTDAQGLLLNEVYAGQKLNLDISTKDSHHIPMMVAKGSGGNQFTTLVPSDADLRVQVHSSEFQVADAAGNKLNSKNPALYLYVHSLPAAITGQEGASVATPLLTLQLVGRQ